MDRLDPPAGYRTRPDPRRLGYPARVETTISRSPAEPLPADDPALMSAGLRELARRWSTTKDRAPMSAAAMTGADRRAQALGVPGARLMEHAGTAVAAAVRAVAADQERLSLGPVLVLCGPGNNGGDGLVAARRLGRIGLPVVAVLVSGENRPGTPDAAKNWDRLAGEPTVTRIHAAVPRDLAILAQGIEKASVVVDALLGTGVRGALREPVRSAVELIRRAREAGVPVVAVDTPTAVDLTSGEPSDPAVRADLTVTFHRPKTGLQTKRGAALAGRVLVAPIGIPAEADRG
jgi:ADP-dependent NAD(P)H-hydrate dehydratase / NAD(P)H-hydrate epimerase